MPDQTIHELPEATTITANDLFVMEQANAAKKLSGQTMITFLTALADGHGGISSIAKSSSTGTNPVVDTYLITYADASTSTFNVTNGRKGDTGATGPQGPKGDDITIQSYSVEYIVGSSGTVEPTGTWQSTVPSVPQGSYLWTRMIVNYSDGTGITSFSVSRFGIDGSGAVSTVNSKSPDGNGNVQLAASDVGALPSSYTPPVTSVNGSTGTVTITAAGLGAATVSNGKVTASQASSAIVSKTANFTLDLSNDGCMIKVTSSSAVTATVPTNASVAFPLGAEIEIVNLGTGDVTIAGASGVTIQSLEGLTTIAGQYGTVGLKKIDTNVWLLAGALK